MKKLLLLLLFVPFIGLGQDQIYNGEYLFRLDDCSNPVSTEYCFSSLTIYQISDTSIFFNLYANAEWSNSVNDECRGIIYKNKNNWIYEHTNKFGEIDYAMKFLFTSNNNSKIQVEIKIISGSYRHSIAKKTNYPEHIFQAMDMGSNYDISNQYYYIDGSWAFRSSFFPEDHPIQFKYFVGFNIYDEDSVNIARDGMSTLKKDMTKITGRVIHYFSNGNVEGVSHYKNGLLHGEMLILDDEGNFKTFEGSWYEGNPDGIHKKWHDNGQIVLEEKYDNGELISSNCWNERGYKIDCE